MVEVLPIDKGNPKEVLKSLAAIVEDDVYK
jgi:hypothetical protein